MNRPAFLYILPMMIKSLQEWYLVTKQLLNSVQSDRYCETGIVRPRVPRPEER